jgi:hypothetical protein
MFVLMHGAIMLYSSLICDIKNLKITAIQITKKPTTNTDKNNNDNNNVNEFLAAEIFLIR